MPDNNDDLHIILCSFQEDASFPDNIKGKCADCQRAIVWRPHVPANYLKVCGPCAVARMDKAGQPEFEVYDGQRRELEEIATKYPSSTVTEFVKALLKRTRKH